MMGQKISIKLNDKVEVVSGKDKGRVGKVVRVLQDQHHVVVEKVNIMKKHTKPTSKNQQGGIIEKEASLHASKVMLICPKCTRTVRVGKKKLDNGEKVRVCIKCGETIEPKA